MNILSSPDLERAVLGACILDREAFSTCGAALREQTFASQKNRTVFAALQRLSSAGMGIDLLTVSESLRKCGDLDRIGGPHYLVELTNAVAGPAHLEYHIQLLKQYEILREAGRISMDMQTASLDPMQDPIELVDRMQRDFYTLLGSIGANRETDTARIVQQEIAKTEKLRSTPGALVGMPTGLDELDKLTGGLQAPDLAIFAARPGMGKTAFVLSIAKNVVNAGNPVGMFSLEMSASQLIQRLASMESGVPLSLIKNPRNMDAGHFAAYTEAMERISGWPLYIDDTPGISVFEMRAKARRWAANKGVKLVIVDYLQLATDTGTANGRGNREQEVGAISRGLKGIAKELDVPVIALSQLSRAVETRGGLKRPQLSDLRESGSIEQDSDIVGFIYRPEYYDIKGEEGENLAGLAEIIIAKHRNGPLDTVHLFYKASHTEFCNAGERYEPTEMAAPVYTLLRPAINGNGVYNEDLPF